MASSVATILSLCNRHDSVMRRPLLATSTLLLGSLADEVIE
jgi:hypothetical protein